MADQNGTGSGGGATSTTTTSAGTGDSANQNQNQNGDTGADANKNANVNNNQNQNNDGGSTFDPEKDLTKEQWQAIYGSGRFKDLNDRAKKAAELEKAQKDAEEKQLKEKGEWQKVAESKDQQLTSLQTAVVNAEIKAEAARLGAVNPSIVANALNRSGINFDNGDVTGVEEAVNSLKESDPYLFNNSSNNQKPRVGSPTNPGGNSTGYKFTMSQIRDPKFYREHAAEIKTAVAQGQVDKDS